MNNIYVELTKTFNAGRLRAVLTGGQAVVLHRLAIMSKDGDWVLREDEEALRHILTTLAGYGARYRFGAPLDGRWMTGGWSAHFEFSRQGLRVRTDFVTRPPRLEAVVLAQVWQDQERRETAYLGIRELAETKKTRREKDYAVIAELARRLADPDDQLLLSRSARDLMTLAAQFPRRVDTLAARRPVLQRIGDGLEALEAALDAERRQLIREDESRISRYMQAAEQWASSWPRVSAEIESLPLWEAHQFLVQRAETILPFHVSGASP